MIEEPTEKASSDLTKEMFRDRIEASEVANLVDSNTVTSWFDSAMLLVYVVVFLCLLLYIAEACLVEA